jgi:hypothetical protein
MILQLLASLGFAGTVVGTIREQEESARTTLIYLIGVYPGRIGSRGIYSGGCADHNQIGTGRVSERRFGEQLEWIHVSQIVVANKHREIGPAAERDREGRPGRPNVPPESLQSSMNVGPDAVDMDV